MGSSRGGGLFRPEVKLVLTNAVDLKDGRVQAEES